MTIHDARIEVDGLSVRYLEAGEGAPVVLLHGASPGSSADAFGGVLGPLAVAGLRAIAYDQPGYGLTDNPRDFTTAYRTRFILRFMDALGVERAWLVGHSQAGGMALQVAVANPERVSGLVVVCTGSLLPALPGQTAPAGRPASGYGGGEPREPTLDGTRRILEADLFHKELATDDAVRLRHELSLGKNFVAATERAKAQEPPAEGGPPWRRFAEVRVPLLMLYGDHDRASAAERAALLKEQQPQLDVQVVQDAAHLLMWDAPEEFVSKVTEFVKAD